MRGETRRSSASSRRNSRSAGRIGKRDISAAKALRAAWGGGEELREAWWVMAWGWVEVEVDYRPCDAGSQTALCYISPIVYRAFHWKYTSINRLVIHRHRLVSLLDHNIILPQVFGTRALTYLGGFKFHNVKYF